MSNSRKESKLLLEGWRKFLVKEAEEPAKEGGNTIRIFDFDGTLVTPRTPTKYSKLLGNLFYVPFLNSAKYKEVMNELKAVAKDPANHNTEIEKLMNPSKDYIVTAMSSIGIDKPITQYLLFQLAKNDQMFLDFARTVAGVNIETAYKGPVGPDEDVPEQEEVSGDTISQEEIGELKKALMNAQPPIADVKDSYRMDISSPAVKKIISKLKTGFDVGKKVSMEDLEEVKKDIVAAAYPKMSKDRIKVSLNIAMLPEDPEQSGIVKGSSGKFKPAKEIAAAHPGAKFEVYDNNVTSMSQVRMGLMGKTSDQAKVEAEKESEEKIDDATPLSALENKIALIKNSLQGTSNTDFKLVRGNQLVDYNNGPFTLGKKDPSNDPKMVGIGGGYRSLRKLASVYIRKAFLPTTESGKGRTSAQVIQAFKAFKTYCDNNGYKDLMDAITFQGAGYAPIYKFFEPATQGVQPTFELNRKVAEQLVKLYDNAEAVKKTYSATISAAAPEAEKPVEPSAEPAAAPEAEPEQKAKKAARPAAITGEEGADEGEIETAAFEDDDLAWNEMSDSAKKKYRIEYRKKKAALRETVLKELKPLLKKISKLRLS